jgi:hypothetical protein
VIGSAYQRFPGIYLTQAKEPPPGVEFKKELLNWSEIKRIEWTGAADGKVAQCKVFFSIKDKERAKKLKSGSDFFAWIPAQQGYHPLQRSRIKISGKMRIDKVDEEIEIRDGKFIALEFGK